MEIVSDFTFLGSKVTAGGDCGHEIKRCLLLGRKAMTNLDSILKSRDITLLKKVHLLQAMVFPLVMYGCESWTIRKVERWRTDVLELWCWRRLLRVPWTARRSNQSILKEISPEYSLAGLVLKLKLQYFGHLMLRTTHLKTLLCWERLKAGGKWTIECEVVGWYHWLSGHEFEQAPRGGDGHGGLACTVHGVTKSWTRLSDWNELNWTLAFVSIPFPD